MRNYNCTVQKTVSITTISTEVLLHNTYRKYLFIQNQGTDKVYIMFDGPQSSAVGKMIGPNSSYEPVMAPNQAVYMIARAGTQSVFICEGNE